MVRFRPLIRRHTHRQRSFPQSPPLRASPRVHRYPRQRTEAHGRSEWL